MAGIRQFMEQQIPFNAFLGIEVVALESGSAALKLPFREQLIGDPVRPALHGGTLAMLADTAGGAAVFSAIQFGDTISTIDLRVDYLRPADLLDTVAEARVVRQGGRVAVARVELWQDCVDTHGASETQSAGVGDRRLVAEATAVYNIRRRKT
ncbi:MAG TPA: thioesterase [Deltaproteobacteria bacterium]|nr:thioesterase [Deltaproteobacteria bacterium]HCP47176.1 thioesterase [Deltaproteobacteria bacterium]